jgi:hypothetical protein
MGGANMRWIVGAGALLVAAVAFYLLLNGRSGSDFFGNPTGDFRGTASSSEPALDEIDAESRAAMRELLRNAGGE